jgi:RNA polymerase sigma factor (sigma-70 family)
MRDIGPTDMNYSFEELVNQFSNLVTRLCYINLKNYHDAQDCYQNVFLKLWKHPVKNKGLLDIKKWLIVVTMNDCRDLQRKLFRRQWEDIDSLIIKTEDKPDYQLLPLVKTLPKEYASVLFLYYYEGYSVKEIAGMLRKNENTVKTWMRRGRELLKGAIIDGALE